MKRILAFLIDGRKKSNADVKIEAPWANLLASRLEIISKYCPKDFSRSSIDIKKHQSLKATQYRQILFYSGPVIFRGIIKLKAYLHFLILHILMRILARPNRSKILDERAKKFSEIFVNRAEDVYGEEFLSYNSHGLLHIVDDAIKFGSLDEFSAFPYENNMKSFHNTVRKPNQLLQQIYRRQVENQNVMKSSYQNLDAIFLKYLHTNGPVIESLVPGTFLQYKNLESPKLKICITSIADNCLLFKNGKIGLVQNILKIEESIRLIVKYFKSVKDFFDFPLKSSEGGTFLCSDLEDQLNLTSFNDIDGKCFRMPFWDGEILTLKEEPVQDTYVVSLLLSSENTVSV